MSSKAMGNFLAMSHIPCAEDLGFSQGRKVQNHPRETPPPSPARFPLAAGISPHHLSYCCPWPHQVTAQICFPSQGASTAVARDLSSPAGASCPAASPPQQLWLPLFIEDRDVTTARLHCRLRARSPQIFHSS